MEYRDDQHWEQLRVGRAFLPSEILVAVSQERAVLRELTAILQGEPTVAEVDRVLGLELITLDGLESRFERDAEQRTQEEEERAQRAGVPNTRGPFEAVDVVLEKLRGEFRTNYHFEPTVGKNRMLAQVGDLHNIGIGSDGAPRPYIASEGTPGLSPRTAFPGTGVQVGVADTAIFENKWIAGAFQAAPYDRADYDLQEPYIPTFTEGHAAFVAGLILQQAPGCTIVARRVLDNNGEATAWSVAQELVKFAHSGISVLNLSLGCFTDDNEPPLALATALDRIGPEVVVVAAAGNHGRAGEAVRPMWPAALEEVIAVGAVDHIGTPCPWSPPITTPWLDAVAVGAGVVSTYVDGKVRVPDDGGASPAEAPWTAAKTRVESFATPLAAWSGTSFAAATVSGAITARTDLRVYSPRAAWDALCTESEAVEGSGPLFIQSRPLLAPPRAGA